MPKRWRLSNLEKINTHRKQNQFAAKYNKIQTFIKKIPFLCKKSSNDSSNCIPINPNNPEIHINEEFNQANQMLQLTKKKEQKRKLVQQSHSWRAKTQNFIKTWSQQTTPFQATPCKEHPETAQIPGFHHTTNKNAPITDIPNVNKRIKKSRIWSSGGTW